MENLIIELAKQVPNLGILGVIVWVFLRHLETRDKAYRDVMQELHEEHIEERILSRQSREEMTKVLSELKDTIKGAIK